MVKIIKRRGKHSKVACDWQSWNSCCPSCVAKISSKATAFQILLRILWLQATGAAKGREWAEAQQAAAEAGLQDARLHMDWQDMRIADLEGRDVSQMASRYGT